ncbi:transcription factor 20 [Lepisosteus oculatus]|uniref:transcription factor 20 n=1 Tax=Lepisosteus oculatus TaxID=7918 RepID=UPI0037115A8B
MDPPPSSQSDGLHPQQDLAPCSISSVYDLTMKHKDSLLKNSPMEALHVVSAPSWYSINSGSKGVFQENSSERAPHPSDQIQPDDAFSNTTVTLSYVSRSHVFTPRDSLSPLPQLRGPPVHQKLSCLSPKCEPGALVSQGEADSKEDWEADGRLCAAGECQVLQNSARPAGGAQVEQTTGAATNTPAHECGKGAAPTELARGQNGRMDVGPLDVAELQPQLGDRCPEGTLSPKKDEGGHMHNGTDSASPDVGICEEKVEEIQAGVHMKGEKNLCNSEVLVVISRTEEPVVSQDSPSCRNVLRSPANGEYHSPLEEDWSPATSQDKMEDITVFPQTLNSPSFENSSVDGAADTVEESVGEGELSADPAETESTVACVESLTAAQDRCSKKSEVTEDLAIANGVQALPDSIAELPGELSNLCGEPSEISSESDGRGCVNQQTSGEFLLNGNVLAEERLFARKKLPPRSQRGRRLEEIVQNITPSRHKASANFHSTKKNSGSKPLTTETHQEDQVSLHEDVLESDTSQDGQEKLPGPEEEPCLNAAASQKDSPDKAGADRLKSKKSTSDQKHRNVSISLRSGVNSRESPAHTPKVVRERRGQFDRTHSPEKQNLRALPKLKACQKNPPVLPKNSPGSKKTASARKTRVTKRKRKKRKMGQSSMFSPKEPEIKLKYVNYKEEKRDVKTDSFSPYIRLEFKEYATCTVINYPEEEKVRLKKGRAQTGPAFISGAVPTTSCLLLGRLNIDWKWRSHLVCCLCGKSANTMDLGDLHGPYYPEGFKPSPKPRTGLQSLKDDDLSDSDSSCSARGRKRSQAAESSTARLLRGAQSSKHRRWASDGDCVRSPVAKKPKTDSSAEDWYSPPVVPLDTREYWLHEDCGIWAAGVYLVKGKLYGLEEAAKLAQETVCSLCHRTGATLGCFFKGCPSKYHYTCAAQSDCVLNEENFSMKCTKHKNKSFKGSASVNRLESR